jgi:hypothetical protein
MKVSLHPGVTAAIVAVLAVAVGTLFVRLGDRTAAKSDTASPYSQVGQRPTSPGSGVNSITGEPLSDTAKGYAASAFEQNNAPQAARR